MELKLFSVAFKYRRKKTFNRTAYGIEIQLGYASIDFPFLLIAPLMELK